MLTELTELSATEAVSMIFSGKISSEELVRACIERIEEREPIVRAWQFFDPELALKQARSCDKAKDRGPLCGVPVAVKDHTDTADMPTGYGSTIYAGYRPATDAQSVARLRTAGAVVAGKTRLTEFSLYHPTDTRNPRDTSRTPGGSSSGSAAAVADCMVPDVPMVRRAGRKRLSGHDAPGKARNVDGANRVIGHRSGQHDIFGQDLLRGVGPGVH